MSDKEIQQRCKDELEMQVEIFRSCYAKGYNDAKREIVLSGEYERAYQRGYEDGKSDVLDNLRAEIEQRKQKSGGEPNRELAFNVCLQIVDKYRNEVNE